MAKNIFSGLFGKRKEIETPDEPETGAEAPADVDGPAARSDQRGSETDEPQTPPPADADAAPRRKNGLFARLRAGLSKTSSQLTDGVAAIFTKQKLDEQTLDDFEDLLISADLGVAAAGRIREALARERYDKEISAEEIRGALSAEVAQVLKPLEKPLLIDPARKPHVILTIGVNGAGKTTTIGKLAAKFKQEGKSVMLAAGDTFRAAAVEQLVVWGERTDAPVVRRDIGADAAGLAYDALESAKRDGTDVLIIDTAGRLQNKRALMDELAKIVRVLKKLDPEAPHDVLLVLDATVGQNALSQAEAFREIAGVTGLVMTKLDGTARGGVLVALADKFAIPIHFIGVGEGVEDLQPFRAESFARALAGLENAAGEES